MKLKRYVSNMFAALALSTSDSSQWTELAFNKIPANKVTFSKDHIEVDVVKSASPLIYKFPQIQSIKHFSATIEVLGDLNKTMDQDWRSTFEEDSVFRIGLVAEGSKKLSGISALFAADWVQKMFSLAPKGTGLDKIYFYNVSRFKELVGKKRIHPASGYLSEENVLYREAGKTEHVISKTFEVPVKTAGIWISIDGDDSQSQFKVRIKQIEIH